MTELERYVDTLFRHQRRTPGADELKAEILSNMQAKQADLMAQGLSEAQATEAARNSIASIDGLLDCGQLTYLNRYHTACAQTALLASVLFWLCSLPLMLVGRPGYSYLGLIATVAFGILYRVLCQRDGAQVAFCSYAHARHRAKLVWLLWGVFLLAAGGMTIALQFGSDLWFGRWPNVTGPYQCAVLVAPFYGLLLTIAFPITVSRFPALLRKEEKRDSDV